MHIAKAHAGIDSFQQNQQRDRTKGHIFAEVKYWELLDVELIAKDPLCAIQSRVLMACVLSKDTKLDLVLNNPLNDCLCHRFRLNRKDSPVKLALIFPFVA